MKWVCLVFCCLGVSTTVLASPITLDIAGVTSRAGNGAPADNIQSLTTLVLPASGARTAQQGAGNEFARSTTSFAYSVDGSGEVTFAANFDHEFDNTGGQSASTLPGAVSLENVFFTADVDSAYTASGFYQAVNPFDTSVQLTVTLFDLTTSQLLYRYNQYSQQTANESFVLDNLGGQGDRTNVSVVLGTQTGALTAGHAYQFSVLALLSSATLGSVETFNTASANGSVTLEIVSVPLPSALWFFLLGLCGLAPLRGKKSF